ncbi:MAG: class I SAM-dependent methyltransferase, partial [Actinomycetota bacterium]
EEVFGMGGNSDRATVAAPATAPPKLQTMATYDAAADRYDDDVLSFWSLHGERTVDRLGLRPGDVVLDVCCGTGASALPAAKRVGPGGRVIGVDLSEGMLARARAKAQAGRLRNLVFRAGDMEQLGLPPASFDAVVCAFGIFFATDMVGQVAELWRMVRPGGRLAVTTWGEGAFEPAAALFWDIVRGERPDLYRGFNPWDRIVRPDAVLTLLLDGGARGVEAEAVRASMAVRSVEDFWTLALGTGLRAIVEQLGPGATRVRETFLSEIAARRIDRFDVSAVFATATKPAGASGP